MIQMMFQVIQIVGDEKFERHRRFIPDPARCGKAVLGNPLNRSGKEIVVSPPQPKHFSPWKVRVAVKRHPRLLGVRWALVRTVQRGAHESIVVVNG